MPFCKLPPCWCFLGNFFKLAKLIWSQYVTQYRYLKNVILTTFRRKARLKEKNIYIRLCFLKIFISDEINLADDHKNSPFCDEILTLEDSMVRFHRAIGV